MGNLTEVDQWEPNVYELATTDPVMAGPGGIDNLQPQQLANRTTFLNNMRLRERSGALNATDFPIALTPDNQLVRLNGAAGATLGGDITMPDPSLCVGRMFTFYANSAQGGNPTTLKPFDAELFNDGDLDHAQTAANGRWIVFTPDGVDWIVMFLAQAEP